MHRCYNCNKVISSVEPFALYRSVIEFYDGRGKQTSVDQTMQVICISCAYAVTTHATRFPDITNKGA